jgi:cold shock protein
MLEPPPDRPAGVFICSQAYFVPLAKKKFGHSSKLYPPLHRHIAKHHSIKFFLMHSGTVKFFNGTKGFGFIVDSSTSEEIFVHVSGLIDDIREGDTVTFDTQRGKKGMNAVNVKLA